LQLSGREYPSNEGRKGKTDSLQALASSWANMHSGTLIKKSEKIVSFISLFLT